ncbi:TlpA disulfide reductase family protein [Actinomycetes bacterium KLBMP 9797]
MSRPFIALALVSVLVLGACDGGDPAPEPSGAAAVPFADCAALTAPPPRAAAPPSTAAPDPTALPDISLPCFAGDATVAVADIRGPAVINLWGSWCPPCRAELPAFQRFAARAAGKVHVIGVDTHDTREAGASLAADLGVTYPNLYDRSERFRIKLGGRPLPVTLFVDQQGLVRHVYNAAALDDAELATLAARHLGVTLP